MPHPADPAFYPRRHLLAVVGLSPQVVTETLHALIIVAEPAFVPTQIEVVTTAEGRSRTIEALLNPATGAFHSFCRDYDLALPSNTLTAEHVFAIPDRTGQPLEDIRTACDSCAAADAIVARIRALTEDADCALHVSIAGGRKTMGFLAGHALSLFGRPQDRLSHVMVDEPFMSMTDFFYPPPRPRLLRDHSSQTVSAADTIPTLADVPFLRLREHLPPTMLADTRTYTETIALAQAALDPVLEIDIRRRVVRFGGRIVRLPPAELAWLAWMAARRCNRSLAHGGALHWTEAEPNEILLHYAQFVPQQDVARTRRALVEDGVKALFEQRTAKLNKLVRDGIGPAAGPYLLQSDRRRPKSRTGLLLPPDRIKITT